MKHPNETKNGNAARELIRSLTAPNGASPFGNETRLIETHISWVILTGDYAYKIKKPVDLGFLDFSTPDRRRHFCDEELRLNRRFAPSLYLDVVPIGGTPTAPIIDQEPAIEWAVRMRRFPDEAGLDLQVESDTVTTDDMQQFGALLARIHAQAEASIEARFGSLDAIQQPALDNFTSIERDCANNIKAREDLSRLRSWTLQACAALAPLFAQRLADGRIRECHGDLHLGNIVHLGDQIVAFDCLEFDPALRWIDVVSDVGFLYMDLLRVGRADLACAFLSRYLEASDDYAGLTTLPFYAVYRALVRAKTTALRIAQKNTDMEASEVVAYLTLGKQLAFPTERPVLIICHGLSGSGKTHLSDSLIAAIPAIRVRSDIVRKRLHGMAELETSYAAMNAGIYDAASTRETYAQLAADAGFGLRAGINVIVDATCLRSADRQCLVRAAEGAKAATVFLSCEADPVTLEERIRARHARGVDASEADVAVLRGQQAAQEPLSSEELERTVRIDTTRKMDSASIATEIRALALSPGSVH